PKKRRRYPPRRSLSPPSQTLLLCSSPDDRPKRRTSDARGTTCGPLCPTRRTSPRGTRQPQPADPLQNRPEQLAGHRHLRQLEDDVLGVCHHLGPDLDQLLTQCREGPALDRLQQYQLPKEVGQVVRQGEQLKPR